MHSIINKQIAREIAMLIYKDVKPYIKAHPAEYQRFLAEYKPTEGEEVE